MTLVAAWVKDYDHYSELFVASDSRLNGGKTWDIGCKILDLERGDSVIAFAGSTDNAFPLMLQLQSAIKMHPKLKSRAYDLTEVKGHMLRIFNAMWTSITNLPRGQKKPDPAEVKFILAGYSWAYATFKIWTLYFHDESNSFRFREASKHRKRGGGNKYFAFIGDDEKKARAETYQLLKERGRISAREMLMEPFEVLLNFINDESKPSIGGCPQIYKIYQHLNTLPYNIYWPNKESGQICFSGRVLLPYERNEYLAFDPTNFEVGQPDWPDPSDFV